jgi:hypothetical protein
MASIVKAKNSLNNGGLAVLKRTFSTADGGQVNYRADYACLSQFANNHTRKFLSGSQPPTSIPSAMLLLNLSEPPALNDLQTETTNGMTYFRASYMAYLPDVIIETSTEQSLSSLSGTRNYSYFKIVFANGLFTPKEFVYSRNWRAQILITSVTTSSQGRASSAARGQAAGGSGSAGYIIISREGPVPTLSSELVTTSRTYKSSDGKIRTDATTTVIVSAPTVND